MRRPLILLTVALAVSLAGCGSASSAPSAAGSTAAVAGATSAASVRTQVGGNGAYPADPCSLLTTAQVSSATGWTVSKGDSAGDTHSCTWLTAGGSVIVDDNEGPGLCDSGSSSALGITVTQISGLGTKACVIDATGLSANLTFYQGPLGFTVTVGGGNLSRSNLQAIEQKLAADVLSNL